MGRYLEEEGKVEGYSPWREGDPRGKSGCPRSGPSGASETGSVPHNHDDSGMTQSAS